MTIIDFLFAESILNMHEDVRAKPSSWSIVGWLPLAVIDEELSTRPTKDYHRDSGPARDMRIHHECWRRFVSRSWITETKYVRLSCTEVVKQECLDIIWEPFSEIRCILYVFSIYTMLSIINHI